MTVTLGALRHPSVTVRQVTAVAGRVYQVSVVINVLVASQALFQLASLATSVLGTGIALSKI